MAENVNITPGSGDVIGADDISSVKYQRVKLITGADGVNDGDVASANPLPVDVKSSLPAGTNNIGDVDIASALPAGTNAIGKLAANSGVDIGDVDVTSIVTGTGATNLGKAEDAVHSSEDVGVMALAVRRNTATDSTSNDGDYSTLITDSSGKLHVSSTFPSAQAVTVSGKTTDDGPEWTLVRKYTQMSTTSDTTIWNPAVERIYITDLIVSVGSTATQVRFAFGSGTAMTDIFLIFNGDVKGGLTHTFRTPIKSGTDDFNLNCDISDAADVVDITILGYELAT